MLIKRPASSNAIDRLWSLFEFIENRSRNCNDENHDFLTIVYLSTLIISPYVTHRGQRLLDKIRDLVSLSPQRVVCIFRTASPYSFPNSRFRHSLRELQRMAIDFLRDKCYIVVYSKRWEFLNHAKFLIYYHVCLSENIQYHGKYYGSTNLTNAGLSSKGYLLGNYEEFMITGPKPRFLNFTGSDSFYLNEIYDLLLHEVKLYTDPDYLRNFFSEHFKSLNLILQNAQRILSGTTLGELYNAYMETQVFYNRTFSLLDQLPGKNLTAKLIESIEKEIKPPEYPFELEIGVINDIKSNEGVLRDLGFNDRELRGMLSEAVNDLEKVREKLDEYTALIDSIDGYFDEKERKFIEFIKRTSDLHIQYIEKIRMLADRRK